MSIKVSGNTMYRFLEPILDMIGMSRQSAASNLTIPIHRPRANRNYSGFVAISPAFNFDMNRIFLGQLVAALALMFSCVAAAEDVYLRTGVGLDRSAETVFRDRDCASESPAALYGCGFGGDGAPYRTVGDFEAAGVFELGLGYKVSPRHRFELLVENRPHFKFHGRANFLAPGRQQSVAVDLSSLSTMAVAYVDFPARELSGLGAFEPFIGLGIGSARYRLGETRMTFPRTATLVPGGAETDFAWMLTAGVAMPLEKGTTLEFAWRYSDLGEIQTAQGEGRVIWRDGSRDPLLLNLDRTRARLRTHGIRLSLRFAF